MHSAIGGNLSALHSCGPHLLQWKSAGHICLLVQYGMIVTRVTNCFLSRAQSYLQEGVHAKYFVPGQRSIDGEGRSHRNELAASI